MINASEEERFGRCPFFTTQRLIQGKWAILIMHYLKDEPVRFNELQRKMPKMTHATLSNQLKQLEKEGLIERIVYSEMPPKVEYSLTEIGRKFKPVLDSIRAFGQEYISYFDKNGIDDKN
ncbi:MAG: helix-turn-helix transcriptional regulator [Firmicutes bacterium]|nr:helix-turn-helix transcriptional regulator [Bacillota bacterium]